MIEKVAFVFICIISMLSCGNSEIKNIRLEVEALESEGDKMRYLEDIMDKDQVYRKRSKNLIQKYGHDSNETQENDRAMMKMDKLNQKKIEVYLDTYGYPSYSRYGSEANTAPWMVFHHSADYGVRLKYFPLFHKAWKEDALGGDDFSFYLNRMYRMKKGNLVKMPGPFRDEELIDTIMKSLKLDPGEAE